MFGNKIEVYMDTIGQPIDEYLVNFEFFVDIMKKNGFRLAELKGNTNLFRKEYFENGLGQFENVIENLPEIRKTDMVFKKYYSDAYDMYQKYVGGTPLKTLSSFNSYFVFQKI